MDHAKYLVGVYIFFMLRFFSLHRCLAVSIKNLTSAEEGRAGVGLRGDEERGRGSGVVVRAQFCFGVA